MLSLLSNIMCRKNLSMERKVFQDIMNLLSNIWCMNIFRDMMSLLSKIWCMNMFMMHRRLR